jgi:hypothetical protein
MTKGRAKSRRFEDGWRLAIRCLSCHDIIASEYAGQYKTCKCKATFINETPNYIRHNCRTTVGFIKLYPKSGSLVYYSANADSIFIAEQDASENHTMRIFLDNLVTRLISAESFNNYVKQEDGILCLGKL